MKNATLDRNSAAFPPLALVGILTAIAASWVTMSDSQSSFAGDVESEAGRENSSFLDAFDLRGRVMDVTGNISEQGLAEIERAWRVLIDEIATQEEQTRAERAFLALLDEQPVPNATVVSEGNGV